MPTPDTYQKRLVKDRPSEFFANGDTFLKRGVPVLVQIHHRIFLKCVYETAQIIRVKI